MKKMIILLFAIAMAMSMAACSPKSEKTTSEAIEPIYRTIEEWQSRYSVTEYGVNEKLNSVPEGRPSVKCVNGTFVGNTVDGIDVFKGIPYAQAPVGELRFQKAKSVLPSDDIYDATYFGESCLQPISEAEAASLYQQGEDCLKLNIWSNPNSTMEKKPVLVYIHGGGFIYGGTSDPLYEGWNFAYYNPDVIVITITYRMGVMGFNDVSSFEGGDVEEYKTSGNNAFYDQIEALRWIRENISQFGGDSDNVTICGESAGGCAVSILCTMDEAKGLFSKAIPMSGAVNLCVTPDHTVALPQAVKETFGVNSISDFQAVPYDKLSEWWSKGYSTIYNFPVMDGKSLETDMFKLWEDGASKDITIMQGHTQDEFRYYYTVFSCNKPVYLAVCDALTDYYNAQGTEKFGELYDRYAKAIVDLGYDEDEVNICFADDMSLAISNTYQAVQHAKNGGKGYSYTFCIPYDSKFDDFELGAAHAVDCFFLFGNFDGTTQKGTKEQVDASIKFQNMIAAFCKTGDPSLPDLAWPEYNNDTREKMMFNLDGFKVVQNPEKERVNILLEMLDEVDSKYSPGLSSIIAMLAETHPEIVELVH